MSIRQATVWLWGLVVFDIALIFAITGWQITPANTGWVIVASIWLLLSLAGATVALTLYYRRHFARWWSWALLILLWWGGALVVQGFIRIPQPGLSFLSSMIFLFSGLSLLIALCIRLYQRDFGMTLVSWMTAICVWSAIFMWRAYGDLIEAIFRTMEQPGQPSPVQLLNLLFTSACCLIPIALLSFAWHTCVLLWRERKGKMPPCEHTP